MGIPHRWILTLPIIAFCNAINLLNLNILRFKDLPFIYGLLEFIKILINFGISVWLIVGLRYSFEGRFTGILSASLIMGIIGLVNLKKLDLFRVSFNKIAIKDIFKFSVPLIPAQVSMFVIESSDRFFLNAMLDKDSVGIYTLSYQFAMILPMIVLSFMKAWTQRQYQMIRNMTPAKEKKLIKYGIYYFSGLLIITVLIDLLSRLVFNFIILK